MVVLEISKSDRARCHTCNCNIEKDVLKFGTAVDTSGEGYLKVEWHHEACFWKTRALKYFKRKNKKVNILLKLSQFSNQHILDEAGKEKLEKQVLECNLANGTPVALKKAGLIPDDDEEHVEEAPKKKKKRKADWQ